jgi:hypothetical protein
MPKSLAVLLFVCSIHAQDFSGVWCAVSGAQDCIVLQQAGGSLRATFRLQEEDVGEGVGWARGAALSLAIRRLDSGLVSVFIGAIDRTGQLSGRTIGGVGGIVYSGPYSRGGARQASRLEIGGDWIVSDDTGNCRSSISIQQTDSGDVTALAGTSSCENGRVSGTQAGSDFVWVNNNTLRFKYRYTTRSSPRLNDGSAEIVFQSETAGRLGARDSRGNTGSIQIRRQ